MSTHPNAILLLTLTPDDLARKTWRSILQEAKVYKWNEEGVIDEEGQMKIGDTKYYQRVMESEYDEGMQIYAKEGDIVLFDMFTYGYGDVLEWSKLEQQKNELEVWAKEICSKFNCSYKIFVTANYW
jgi:hypothetical protein